MDHGAHGSIEDNDALPEKCFERMEFTRQVDLELSGVYANDQETNLRIMMRRCVTGLRLLCLPIKLGLTPGSITSRLN
jgi:hypothetical protein